MASENTNPNAPVSDAAVAKPEAASGAVDKASDVQPKSDGRSDGKGKKRKRDRQGTFTKKNIREWNENRAKRRPRGGRDGDEAATKPDAADSAHLPASHMRIPFSADEIAAEARRPKRKVAVLIGYAGTGYRGMQINHDERTIEGDLFAAFVKAGAIAKANADDPKKSSLVRCARTDKGVHAAGNVISLKLIVEDADVVRRINEHLPAQIRVWGIVRTINSFSCYQACDSRWYEYLLPSYALLPPHPDSFLGREMVRSAKAVDDGGAAYDEMMRRLDDVRTFWDDVERDVVQPLLDALPEAVRKAVLAQLHSTDEFRQVGHRKLDDLESSAVAAAEKEKEGKEKEEKEGKEKEEKEGKEKEEKEEKEEGGETTEDNGEEKETTEDKGDKENKETTDDNADKDKMDIDSTTDFKAAVDQAVRDVKMAYVAAKRRYRVTPERRARLQEALSQYEGTMNYHNYTIQKSFKEASAKRHIKSFLVTGDPIVIGDTEWLSLRVHGQSFMMHQIRKMVAMAVMVTRCGTPPGPAMQLSYGPRRISIPRAPGLGLLLERPVFDSYNARAEGTFQRAPLDFGQYEDQMRAFKDKEIYARIFDVEESQNVFHSFFHQLDNFKTSYYLWAIPGGYDAAFERFGQGGAEPVLDDAEEDAENPDGGDG